jgi:hypothetical protein
MMDVESMQLHGSKGRVVTYKRRADHSIKKQSSHCYWTSC